MRISSLTFQSNAIDQMDSLQAAIAKTQGQLGSGKRIQEAADDPAGMAQVNQLSVQLSASQQYVANGAAANTSLSLEDQALTDATQLLQSARDLAVEANNSSLSASDRQSIATQLKQQLQDLIGIANRKDSNGDYLFAGYAAGTQPFVQSAGGVSYAGAHDVRQLQVSAAQRLSSGDPGDAVFMNIPAGNGTFTADAADANTGSGQIDGGSVTDPSQWVRDTYTISFSATDPTQYQVLDSSNNVVASGTYSSGDAISFKGVQVTISGTPAAGDQFTVAPAGKAGVFTTLSNLISTLDSTTLTSAQISTRIGGALEQFDGAIDHLSTTQASVGARLNSISANKTSESASQVDIQQSISQLRDVDYAAATTQLNTELVGLQAAQLSYAQIAKLSLFNYLG